MIEERTIEELKTGLTSYVQQITTASRKGGRNHYICPLCKSGSGKNKTGAFSITDDGKAWRCFSCDNSGDIFKLIELHENITDFSSQVKRAAEVAGVRLDPEQIAPAARTEKAAAADYTAYYKKCAGNLNNAAIEYITGRGISKETAIKYNIGFDAAADPGSAPGAMGGEFKPHPEPRVIIPCTSNFYIARRILEKNDSYKAPNPKGSTTQLFNGGALYTGEKIIFLCEGIFDALSFIEAGNAAISYNGKGNGALVIKALEKRPAPGVSFIICHDNEEAESTIEKARELNAELMAMGYSSIVYNVAGNYHDANDAIKADPEKFRENIKAAIKALHQAEKEIEAAAREELEQNSASRYLEALFNSEAYKPAITTGFSCFDREMDGGLYPGLYILGAISSMGKTSLMLQIADQIAAGGHEVLYYTLEMGAKELIARSLSRNSYLAAGRSDADAVTARSVTSGAIFSNYQRINLEKAKEIYSAGTAKHLYYFESLGEIGVDEIRREVETRANINGSAPMVFIDYMQILKPYNESWTEKRNTDKAVTELRKLARDFNITIFAISSLNRGSYKGDIEMDAFKESGAIEYGSDVLLALQTPGLESGLTPKEAKANKETIENEKRKAARELEIKILKNRSGSTGQRIRFTYNAKYNYFAESVIDNMPGWEPYNSGVDMVF